MATRSPRPAGGLALGALAVVLIAAPLALPVGQVPGALKGDEAAYYLLARSLWLDRDALCDTRELERLFVEFPGGAETLWLVSSDDWQTAYFGIPFVYPLLVAPAVGLAGARGMVAVNVALFLAMLWMGFAYLRRFNPVSLAAAYSGLFFLLSAAVTYVFWLQGEIFIMACLCGAIFLALRRPEGATPPLAAASGGLMALVVYLKPPLGLVAVALFVLVARTVRPAATVAWCLAALITVAATAGASQALVREPWVYATPARHSLSIGSPVDFTERKVRPLRDRAEEEVELWSAAHWREMTRPRLGGVGYTTALGIEFLVGRHVGLLPYLPLALSSVLLMTLARAGWERWLLLAAALLSALAWQWYLPGAWAGGGAYFGNRYLVIVYPAFLFLVTRIRPAWSLVPVAGFAAWMLGPGLATAATPHALLVRQAHAVGASHRWLPPELTLATLPGYVGQYHSGAWLQTHPDRVAVRGDELWFLGGVESEAWLLAPLQLEGAQFEIRNVAPGNQVRVCLEEACESVELGAGAERRTVALDPGGPYRELSWREPALGLYRLRVDASWGEQPRWRSGGAERFYLGAALTYLGSEAERLRDVYAVEWLAVDAPAEAPPEGALQVVASVRNTSASTWDEAGATRVAASYHWERPEGGTVVHDGLRTPLPAALPAGREVLLTLEVRAPAEPGDYVLALDLVRERIAWFSQRSPDAAYRLPIRVQPAVP